MKGRFLIFLALGIVLASATLLLRARARSASRDHLTVDQLAQHPEAFANQDLTLQGVVAARVPEQRQFTVIDAAEYQACKVVTCSQYQVPIAFAGELPAAEQLVTITGRLTQPEPGRYLLEAQRVEAVR